MCKKIIYIYTQKYSLWIKCLRLGLKSQKTLDIEMKGRERLHIEMKNFMMERWERKASH